MENIMPENKVQFQKGMSIPEFISLYGTEEQCRLTLEKIRWPNGFVCRECGNTTFCFVKTRDLYQCNSCGYQTTVYRNTIFHSTNLPLTIWFLAMFLLSQSKNGISSLELKRHLGVSYKTSWRIKHKLMQVMMERSEKRKLCGLIELDDAYLGGERRGGKRGRGSENKQPFLAAVQTNRQNHPLRIRLSAIESFTKKEIKAWVEKNVHKKAYVFTDGLHCFRALPEEGYQHIREVVEPGKKSIDNPCFNWVNTVLGNLKNSIRGTYHSSRNGYAKRYLAEFQYRFNRRIDLKNIFIRFVYAALQTPALPKSLFKVAANST
jgi:hypothetical protein